MHKKNPHVSVIIPYLNAFDTIGMTLESISASTYDNFEIVTINDRSDDNSAKLVADIKGTHLSMRNRSGAAIARNQGVAASKGDILFFVDADVTIQPETISEVVKTFEINKDNFKSYQSFR